MERTTEIYLTQKFIPKDKWLELINTISTYNGILKKWKIIITNDKSELRYYINTKCPLPPTINNLNTFLLKSTTNINLPKTSHTIPSFPKIGSNLIDIINYNEIKNKGSLLYLEITFLKLYKDKIKSQIKFYLNKNNQIKKYRAILALPTNILSIDFEGNKRYFYKNPPQYLEIKKILHLLTTDSQNALLSVDTFPYLQGKFYLAENNFNFDKHSIIIGSSGCGKSKFISLLINNISKNTILKERYKVIVLDPHANLEEDIGGLRQVIDFKSFEDSIDLFINNDNNIISSTETLLDLFKSLIADQYNPKLERVLRHSIYLLLTNKTFNFTNLRKIILDLNYRNELIKKLKITLPISIINFFLSDFNDLKTKSYSEAISPIISFIDEMDLLPVFNNDHQPPNLKDTIDTNFLTIFSLDRTKLGNKVTKTISGLIMEQLLTIIQKHEIDKHIIFIIDEVSVIENPILSRFLSEARKYNLSLIIASQYFNQISKDLQNSIFANVINYFIFRISKLDASILVDNINMKIPLNNTKEAKIKILTELNNRKCIARISANEILLPAFIGTTIDYKSIPRIKSPNKNPNPNLYPKNTSPKKQSFNLNSNISLKDILISTSTNKKGV